MLSEEGIELNQMFWLNLLKDAQVYSKSDSLTEDEITAEAERLNFALPKSYKDFLRFCNIQEMENGERYFQFFTTKEIQENITDCEFSEYMPGAVPFAMNGGGCYYVFDTREGLVNDEYPIYAVSAGSLDWNKDAAFFLGNSFLEIIKEKANIENIMFG